MEEIILSTDLPLPKKTNNTKEIYNLGKKSLIITTDKISGNKFSNGIPNKGNVVNRLSAFWFDQLYNVDSCFLSCDIKEISMSVPIEVAQKLIKEKKYHNRTMLVENYKKLPVKCVVRGFLSGLAWEEYQTTRFVSGVKLPDGLSLNMPLPEPIFSPFIKDSTNKNTSASIDEMIDFLKLKLNFDENSCMAFIEESIDIYKQISIHAFNNGIIVADTCLEWGYYKNKLGFFPVLINEVGTPDNSSLWSLNEYCLNKEINTLGRQTIISKHLNKSEPPYTLPENLVKEVSETYNKTYKYLTQKDLS